LSFDDVHMTKHLTFGQIKEELEHFERSLLEHPELRVEYSDSPDWQRNFDDIAGVYAAFDEDELVYVGETGNLRSRMRDLRDERTHTLRQKMNLLDEPLDWLTFKAVTVLFGRKEVEEHIISRHKPRYCIQGRRGRHKRG
jgi:hypothetical protein